jgi:hypothetical protein
MLKASQVRTNRAAFADVEDPGERSGLIADDADGGAVEPREAAHDVRCVVLLDLEELALVDDQADRRADVVGLGRTVRDDRVELRLHAVGVVGDRHGRRLREIVLRQEREQVARILQALVLVLGGEVRDARADVVGHRAAQVLVGDLLAGHGADHVRTGDVHVRGPLDHEDEIGDRRRVHRATGAWPHHQRDLRDHARAAYVSVEDLAVGAERDDALLDAGAARVVDADQRAADPRREVHDLADLLAHDLTQRAAEDREVLAEDADLAAVDRAVPGHDGVGQRAV